MTKYRKKPVVIDAMQFTDETKDQVLNFVTCTCCPSYRKNKPVIIIHTLEGDMTAELGDWIIKGVQGEFYPCKPDVFKMTYEKVENTR